MPSVTLEDVPDPIYQEIRRRAEQHKRSLDQEIIACLEATYRESEQEFKERILRRATEMEKEVKGWLTDEILNEAKNAGRP
jgi:plasmid stability protein